MKHTLFLTASFSTVLLSATLSIKDIDQKVSQIQAPRGAMDGSLCLL
jgi:hypothetical protein